MSEEKSRTSYGLPEKVVFCKKCVMSNQRPASSVEFKHTTDYQHQSLNIDEEGICDACRYAEQKEKIDWKVREQQLHRLLDKYRRKDGGYDCVVPGSGGKDSCLAAHLLKYKYGMHPLTVTWPPILYTDIGWQNYRNWIERGGFDNITFKPNGKVMKLLTRLAIENLLHPFHTFILGQKNIAPKIALKYKIPLIFYGENEAEHGNPIAENAMSLRDKSYYATKNLFDNYLAGVSIRELIERYKILPADLMAYLPADYQELEQSRMQVHYLGYYIKWTPQEAYRYAAEHIGFRVNPERTEGTYSKYSSLDDRIDGFHYYTSYIKFGLGRTSYDASQEIRNKHLTREEGISLVRRFDGEFPRKYFREVMDCIDMDSNYFFQLCDKFRSSHLWEKQNGEWKLKYQVE